ncbi:MAG: hypothetical protein NDI94_02225 [Candidatus Woesearchaeota archaeon]|nr:hypothetical protein [Candidatus Woesearchaeota archaeon]
MKSKMMFVFMTMVLAILTLGAAFAAVDCDVNPCYGNESNTPELDVLDCTVKVNGRIVKNDVTVLKAFERGEELDVEIEFTSLQDAEDVQIFAYLAGYHRSKAHSEDIFDLTSTFDTEASVSYRKTLSLRLPDDFEYDTGDELKLRIEIADKFHTGFSRVYNLKVEPQRDSVVIQDIVLDPDSAVMAGRGLFSSVRVRNMGEDTEESLRIEVSMPSLGLKATEYIDELEADESTTSEDMFLRIPACADAGTYVVRATVSYADGDEEIVKEEKIEVVEDENCGANVGTGTGTSGTDKTVVTVPGKQDVVKGTTGSVYPIIIQNNGATDRSYELKVSGLDSWATFRMDPGAFVIMKAGETKTVYLYVTPKEDAQPGEKIFMVGVETSGDSKQIPLTANVVEGEKTSGSFSFGKMDMKSALEIGLVVLVVLLIILGLIVGFNKLKGSEEKDEVSGQTYY